MTPTDGFFPKKSFGQNFLVNPAVALKIVNACDLTPADTVLEIGPGKGALTKLLAKKVKAVFAVEKDRKLAARLQQEFQNSNIQIREGDILDYPLKALPENTKIIGNLPYNISTPIIKAVIRERSRFRDFYATVQFEYGQRITAAPGTKAYGALSCFAQYHADIQMLFKIRSTAFRPAPKVQSCFLHFKFPRTPKYSVKNEDLLFRMIRGCFQQRRKTIRNGLSAQFGAEKTSIALQRANISPDQRAENLCLEEFIVLSESLG